VAEDRQNRPDGLVFYGTDSVDGTVESPARGPSPIDRMAEEVLYQRVQGWLKDRFREAELLESGPQVEAAVSDGIQHVMQAYRREAAISGTPGIEDPAGMARRLADRVLGPGYLAPLLANPDNEEIQVMGGRVRTYCRGRWHLVEHLVPEDTETLRLIRRLLAPGDSIDESSPEVESTLPDGSRLTAVIPPETEQVTLAIRRYVVRHHRLSDLGTLPADAVSLVEAYARAGASIVIAGPGGAGKTTLLRCIVAADDPNRTICSIEDVRELAYPGQPRAIGQRGRSGAGPARAALSRGPSRPRSWCSCQALGCTTPCCCWRRSATSDGLTPRTSWLATPGWAPGSTARVSRTMAVGLPNRGGATSARPWLKPPGSRLEATPTGKELFERLTVRLGKPKAIIAIARKMLLVVWHVLTKHVADREAVPEKVAGKFLEWSCKLGRANRAGLNSGTFIRRELHRLQLGGNITAISRGKRTFPIPLMEGTGQATG
jgi:Type II/IV secretion system protein